MASDTSGMTHARTTDVGSAEATNVSSAEATNVTSTEATHVAAAATHVAATTTVSAATAAGLRARGDKAAGKQCGCQDYHPSSFHELSPLEWAGVPPRDHRPTLARPSKANADVAIVSKMGFWSAVPIKFSVNHRLSRRSPRTHR
jgi:hypothetical protein